MINLLILSGPADSPFITLSGPSINNTVTFTPGGSLTFDLMLMLRDDEDGLEDIESFILSLNDQNMSGIDVSSVANIVITDDDGTEENFNYFL